MTAKKRFERAILLVLSASPKPVTAKIIAMRVPEFTDGDWTEDDVTRVLGELRDEGEVNGASHPDFGTMWKETVAGRLRIA